MTLRGRQAVDRVYAEGRRVDAGMVRCCYLVSEEGPFTAHVAFAVPSRVFNAVRRNRIRRLMRTAFAEEWPALLAQLERDGRTIALLLVFRGAKGIRVPALKLSAVHRDVAAICLTLRAAL